MVLDFRYKLVPRSNGTATKSPSIPVTFHTEHKLGVLCLIDSGADISAMPRGIAEALGVDLSGVRSHAYGIGGMIPCALATVRVQVGTQREHYQLDVPFQVALSSDEFPVLLGRTCFFDTFEITFLQRKRKIRLKCCNKVSH